MAILTPSFEGKLDGTRLGENGTVIDNQKIAVVIPCFKVTEHILDVIANIGIEIDKIYVVDDCCPVGSGKFVSDN